MNLNLIAVHVVYVQHYSVTDCHLTKQYTFVFGKIDVKFGKLSSLYKNVRKYTFLLSVISNKFLSNRSNDICF